MTRLITPDNLGAWLIKCDPEANAELLRQIDEAGAPVVRQWCVADNYRSRMMKPEDPAVLWVSGNGRRLTRGIWGVGQVAGRVRDDPGGVPSARSLQVPLDIRLFTRGAELSSSELVEAGITDLEVQVQAHMSNPSWLSREQFARMEALLVSRPSRSAANGSA